MNINPFKKDQNKIAIENIEKMCKSKFIDISTYIREQDIRVKTLEETVKRLNLEMQKPQLEQNTLDWIMTLPEQSDKIKAIQDELGIMRGDIQHHETTIERWKAGIETNKPNVAIPTEIIKEENVEEEEEEEIFEEPKLVAKPKGRLIAKPKGQLIKKRKLDKILR